MKNKLPNMKLPELTLGVSSPLLSANWRIGSKIPPKPRLTGRRGITVITIIIFIILISLFRLSTGVIQNDNYIAYAKALSSDFSTLAYNNTRLYAGYPVLIIFLNKLIGNWELSGFLVVILSFIGSYYFLFKLTGLQSSILPLIFPPIMLAGATMVAPEYPALLCFLSSLYFWKGKKYEKSFFFLGLTIWFRHNIIPVAIVYFVYLLKYLSLKKLLSSLFIFLIPLFAYGYFNSEILGTGNPLYPYQTYLSIETHRFTFGLLQLPKDVINHIAEGNWRILFSGVSYFILIITLLFASFKSLFHHSESRAIARDEESKKNIVFKEFLFWTSLTYFIVNISIGYVPFLELYPRYFVPIFPFFFLILRRGELRRFLIFTALIISTLAVCL